jgi:hypothetical protein
VGGFGSFRQSGEGLAPMVIQTMLNAGDPTQKLHRKENDISFPEANVQTLRLGCRGSASFVFGCDNMFLVRNAVSNTMLARSIGDNYENDYSITVRFGSLCSICSCRWMRDAR